MMPGHISAKFTQRALSKDPQQLRQQSKGVLAIKSQANAPADTGMNLLSIANVTDVQFWTSSTGSPSVESALQYLREFESAALSHIGGIEILVLFYIETDTGKESYDLNAP
ncbi:uncharacterized protein CLUP02_18202 [Colletotrichum lupini]|uniref:Uncharacterized protein n=1 Tax=Colletotrichum lupini TaxID=145971 RepID=A0A9Q8WBI7_9PEZI|nr:uncharacterized protein CLUP02_18202 [Colletotrichum lupini]UQC76687.1 hypothetical protein CLUP02_18202 [Colletotrichum lupini]